MKWDMRVVLLGVVALGLAGLVQCTTADGDVWILPMSPVSPISPSGFRVQSLEFGVSAVRETVIRPRWSESALEAGDLVLFECELRPGGSLAAVTGQGFVLEYGESTVVLDWDVGDLAPGWYEVLCRPHADGRIQFELLGAVGQDCAHGCGFVFVERWRVE